MAQSTTKAGQPQRSPARLEGGTGEEENPDAASPSSEKPRNSSGSASAASQLLDIRIHLVELVSIMMKLHKQGFIDADTIAPLRRLQQRGFRSNRG